MFFFANLRVGRKHHTTQTEKTACMVHMVLKTCASLEILTLFVYTWKPGKVKFFFPVNAWFTDSAPGVWKYAFNGTEAIVNIF